MALHLVTGGSGFIGSFLCRALLERGESVRSIDMLDDPERDPGIEFQRVNVLDRDGLKKTMQGVDYVHHNAALVPLKKAGDLFWKVNVEGTRNVLEAAKAAGVRHFVHMSSSAVLGSVKKSDNPIPPDAPLKPVEIYGRSKYAGEQIVLKEMKNPEGISCSIIRPRTTIGTKRLGIFQVLYEWISEGRSIYIIGDGSNVFQFVHVRDLVTMSMESAFQQKQGIYHAGTDRYGTLREALEKLCEFAKTGSKVKGIPYGVAASWLWLLDQLRLSPLAPWHYLTYHKDFYFDISFPVNELGWKPKYSNDEMLRESYMWYLENKERLKKRHPQSSAHRGTLRQGVLSFLKKIS